MAQRAVSVFSCTACHHSSELHKEVRTQSTPSALPYRGQCSADGCRCSCFVGTVWESQGIAGLEPYWTTPENEEFTGRATCIGNRTQMGLNPGGRTRNKLRMSSVQQKVRIWLFESYPWSDRCDHGYHTKAQHGSKAEPVRQFPVCVGSVCPHYPTV